MRPHSATPNPESGPTAQQPSNSHLLELQEHQVKRVLKALNPHKAAGPDGVLGKVLKACTDQLSGVLTRIFNISLKQATVPPCLKTATIVPVPKKASISSLNDYRPVALTSVVMKCFERLVLPHLKSCLPQNFNQHQFAYEANRSTADAVATVLPTTASQAEGLGNYVRTLFVDFSLVFNTILLDILSQKLTDLGFPPLTCDWLNSFLTDQPQTVRFGTLTSTTQTLSTGSLQGCVLSPFLYALYTYDCVPLHHSNIIVKFADDTTVVGLISGGDETAYSEEVQRLAAWCSVITSC